MNQIKTHKLLTITAVLAFVLLATGCNEKITYHSSHIEIVEEMIEEINQANNKANHEQLADRYDQEAKRLLEKARSHEKLASVYQQTDNSKMVINDEAARHCRSIAKKFREAAADNSALANLHRQVAEKINQ